jgi:anaphase-promoting complex subunit 6
MLGDEAKVDDNGNVSHTKDSNVIYLDKDSQDREINVTSFSIFILL